MCGEPVPLQAHGAGRRSGPRGDVHQGRLLSDETFVDLDANLYHFSGVYERILADRDEELSGLASLRGDRYRRIRRRYHAYIEAQHQQVRAMLERLPETVRAAHEVYD